MNRLLLFGLTAAVALGFAVLISCGRSSSSTLSDDDTVPADDDSSETCTQAYTNMYDVCGLSFTDSHGNAIPVDQVIGLCESDQSPFGLADACGGCVIDNFTDCAALARCAVICAAG